MSRHRYPPRVKPLIRHADHSSCPCLNILDPRAEKLLTQFLAFVEDRGEEHLTIETALAWATAPAGADPNWMSRRLSDVRRFAIHLRGIDPATQVPPADILPGRSRRATPYLYSTEEISTLMAGTATLRGSHRKATYRTLIGLLAATGMRVGEAIGLDRDDFDAICGVLTIRTRVAVTSKVTAQVGRPR